MMTTIASDIGQKNIQFIEKLLKEERIPVIQRDTGGTSGMQVYFHPVTGHAYTSRPDEKASAKIRREEKLYMQQVNNEIEESDITFF